MPNELKQEGWRDSRQVCVNGHVITNRAKLFPETKKKFCDICGSETIMACTNCQSTLPGDYHLPAHSPSGYVDFDAPPYPPAFCSDCGNPYPWITGIRKIVFDDKSLTETEQVELIAALEELIKDTNKASADLPKYKRLFSKISKKTTELLQPILVNITSEVAKKLLLG